MSARMARVDVYKAEDGWRWRFRRNGRIRADGGQGYSRLIDCQKGARDVLGIISGGRSVWFRNVPTGNEAIQVRILDERARP